jgi:hypothetical protein
MNLAGKAELRAEVWKHIQAENSSVVKKASDQFFAELDQAIQTYHYDLVEERTYHDAYEALRDLFKLIEKEPENTKKIRTKFALLPKVARGEIMRRAEWRKDEFFRNEMPTWENLVYWVENCREGELIEKLPLLIATGRAWSYGQLRSNSERSAPHIEPRILGRLGRLQRPDIDWYKPPAEPSGGRPPKEALDKLLRTLGLLWLEATGKPPKRGRGKTSTFVGAAIAVLQSVGVKNPKTALKRFWGSIKTHKNQESQVPWDLDDDVMQGP